MLSNPKRSEASLPSRPYAALRGEGSTRQVEVGFRLLPVAAQWDPERDTVVEADSSGEALGGCLSQYSDKGVLHPVAYHPARLTAAQRNNTIHDKELLSIISCLKAWSAELRSVARPFTILTDHKNLEYFTAPREMSEQRARGCCWIAGRGW